MSCDRVDEATRGPSAGQYDDFPGRVLGEQLPHLGACGFAESEDVADEPPAQPPTEVTGQVIGTGVLPTPPEDAPQAHNRVDIQQYDQVSGRQSDWQR